MLYNKRIFERCFNHRGKYWYKNIGEIPLYFKLMHHLVKYGYDEYAKWETFDWFIVTMKSILQHYKSNHHGYPVISFDDAEAQEKYEKKYDADIARMLDLLDEMDEDNPKYDLMEYMKKYEAINMAKDEFFKLFAEYFYCLWD